VNTKPKYDLNAMGYNPNAESIGRAFTWGSTPQGIFFWKEQFLNVTPEGSAALAEMQAQWEQEQITTAKPKKLSDSEMLARAIDALRNSPCPSVINGNFTASECCASKQCGCDNAAVLADYDKRGKA
jgi:hypothetical protein